MLYVKESDRTCCDLGLTEAPLSGGRERPYTMGRALDL